MNMFRERLIPNGWTRGEVLKIVNLSGHNLSVVATIWQHKPAELGELPANSIACVTVRKGEEQDANDWIKWWHE